MRFLVFAAASLLSATAFAQLKPVSYSTAGKPSSVAITQDGRHLLLTVTGVGGRRGSAIQVFNIENGKLSAHHLVALGPEMAQGIVLIPRTHMLAVGLSGSGVAFSSADEVVAGRAEFKVLPQGDKAGSGYMSVSADGTYLYVANEYLRPAAGAPAGTVGVIALHPTPDGDVRPQQVTQAPSGNTTPGVALFDNRLYSVAEVVPPRLADKFAGSSKELRRDGCKQSSDRESPSGGLYIWDTSKLNALSVDADARAFKRATVAAVNAGCSPVRLAVTADGKRLYVTARGDNRVLEFDTEKLERDVNHALLRALPTDGTAPVGLALFNHDKSLLVANSNRFAGGTGTLSVIDLESGKVTQTFNAGEFPRNIVLSPDAKTLYVTEFNSNTLLAIPVQ